MSASAKDKLIFVSAQGWEMSASDIARAAWLYGLPFEGWIKLCAWTQATLLSTFREDCCDYDRERVHREFRFWLNTKEGFEWEYADGESRVVKFHRERRRVKAAR